MFWDLAAVPTVKTTPGKMMTENPFTIALFESFKNWGSKDPALRKTYKKMGEPCFDIILSAFDELTIHTPGQYDFWWAKNHMRWIRVVKQGELRYVHELMYHFLTKYARGQLRDDSYGESRKNRKKRKKSA